MRNSGLRSSQGVTGIELNLRRSTTGTRTRLGAPVVSWVGELGLNHGPYGHCDQ